MVRNILVLFVLLHIIGCQSNPDNSGREHRPNIILIIADDMAWDDCGAYGHPSIKTPNIDQLAKDGMLFHQAFLTTSSCSPSRASIITGTYPHQTDAEQLHWPLPGDRITFVEKLKAAGYWTAQAGKWHLGDAIKDRFDFLAPVGTGGFVFNANKGNEAETAPSDDGSGCHQWISTLRERPEGKPFFLWLAAVDPHRPFEPTTLKVHSPVDVRIPVHLPDNDQTRQDLAAYYDEIYRLDQYVGEIVRELEKDNLSENTLILFISDNGRPFPRDKTTLYDGGIKTPWIVKWPARVEKGSQTQALVSSVDIAPTFLSLAGVEGEANFLGIDLSKVLTSPKVDLREFIYAEDHWHDFEDYGRAIRTRAFKYIRNFYPDLPNTPPADAFRSITFQEMLRLKEKGRLTGPQLSSFQSPRPEEELYDMQADPNELNNLASNPDFKDQLQLMRTYMDKVRMETNDIVPASRTADEFDRIGGHPLPNRIRPRPSKKAMGF